MSPQSHGMLRSFQVCPVSGARVPSTVPSNPGSQQGGLSPGTLAVSGDISDYAQLGVGGPLEPGL